MDMPNDFLYNGFRAYAGFDKTHWRGGLRVNIMSDGNTFSASGKGTSSPHAAVDEICLTAGVENELVQVDISFSLHFAEVTQSVAAHHYFSKGKSPQIANAA
ncbi:hypothetical protein Slin15195_G129920 [Septoria linicola]|uniref:Uncharacterized protein n=1 Tax=Septoria linicola TaxID=215465 RepID=A0A9Q9ESJ8_9PEZI|nr:hypothetical protein Slin14017_G128940 [Septoria linicola]USW59673.1 hypothetical protein Slin15195_G129920 [Septoria linicola]